MTALLYGAAEPLGTEVTALLYGAAEPQERKKELRKLYAAIAALLLQLLRAVCGIPFSFFFSGMPMLGNWLLGSLYGVEKYGWLLFFLGAGVWAAREP